MSKGGLIDHLHQQIAQAADQWKEILESVIATIQLLLDRICLLEVIANHWSAVLAQEIFEHYYLAKFDPRAARSPR